MRLTASVIDAYSRQSSSNPSMALNTIASRLLRQAALSPIRSLSIDARRRTLFLTYDVERFFCTTSKAFLDARRRMLFLMHDAERFFCTTSNTFLDARSQMLFQCIIPNAFLNTRRRTFFLMYDVECFFDARRRTLLRTPHTSLEVYKRPSSPLTLSVLQTLLPF